MKPFVLTTDRYHNLLALFHKLKEKQIQSDLLPWLPLEAASPIDYVDGGFQPGIVTDHL